MAWPSWLQWESTSKGWVKPWTYEWWQVKEAMDTDGSDAISGAILPTPTSARSSAVDSFTWHHMAPVVGFTITRNNSTISITSNPEPNYNRAYPYSSYSPKISFYYMDSSGGYTLIGSFGSASEYNYVTHSATVTNLGQTGIYVDCSSSDCSLGTGKIFLGYIKLHTHIDPPSPPVIEATTGKTIKVKDGKDGLYCTSNDDGWYNTPHTFTGLTQGRSYNFKCRENCIDCAENKVFESDIVTGRTWNISGNHVGSGATSMTFKATHTAGTGGDVNAHTITYELYKSQDIDGEIIDTKIGNNGIPVTFTDLEPGETYYCYAYTTNLGNNDNNCWMDAASTKDPVRIEEATGDVSSTTLRASVLWTAGGATSVVCTVECNGGTMTINNSGDYVGFTGLTPGLTYNVSWRVISTYVYEYTYTIINEDGEEEEKTGTRTDVIETTGSTNLTTKKAQFGNPINTTSKIIQFKSISNYSSDVMEQRISSNSNWDLIEQDEYVIYNNLTHNTQYTIYCRIAECYAFNTSGGVTNVNDSEIRQTVSTKLLSLSGSINEEHQHSLVTLWQAYVDGIPTNNDAIDGTAFRFTYMDTLARKNNPPYQAAEVIEGSNGNTSGDYQYNKKVYSNNLTWYYCEYIVTVSITDGYNIVAAAVTAHTIFPASWIFSGGQWHRYMDHVYTNGKYIPAPVFIYKNNDFSEPNGE